MRRSKSYYERFRGAWVNVPLVNVDFLGARSWCLGLVTHVGWRGFMVGHFFLPDFSKQGLPDWHTTLTPANAALICQFSDVGILEGTWPIVGRHEDWVMRSQEWKTPPFRFGDELRYYSEDLTTFESVAADSETAMRYPEDGFAGHIVLEDRLKRFVRERRQEDIRLESMKP